MTDSERPDSLAALTLALVPGIGPRLYTDLVRHFGSPEAVLQSSRNALLRVPGVGEQTANELLRPELRDRAAAEWAQCRELEVTVLDQGAPGYPQTLLEIPDPPAVLFVRGDLQDRDQLAIAIVGARRCTAYGRRQAEKLAGALARAGFTIVSGLARGIDAAAHRGALNAGGRTIGVLATGVRDIYPPEHAELAVQISRQGALVSEFPLDQPARPGLFPQRNRIISGLCLGVIIVEATRTSGALHTARHAQDQGREVFAVPGPVDSLASAGCLELIRDGVTLTRSADDVLAELGPLSQPVRSEPDVSIRNPRELTLNGLETEVLNLIGTTPTDVDDVLRATQLPSSRVLSTLTVLEMKRFVRRLPGNQVVRPE